jgi:hypothetical protein
MYGLSLANLLRVTYYYITGSPCNYSYMDSMSPSAIISKYAE